MASSLLLLLDDIATILDDVSVMTKVAAKKTAGVLGDDLALNAEQVSGVRADRELPVVWAVAKGSVAQQADPRAGGARDQRIPAVGGHAAADGRRPVPLLRGLREGRPQAAARSAEGRRAPRRAAEAALAQSGEALLAVEKDKIKGAIRTDFILSAEIIVIALGTVADRALAVQVGVLVGIAALMTVGVYGLVAGIVKLDDAGLRLSRMASAASAGLGPRHPARRAVADEVPVGRGHGRDVPGRRRHPDPRLPRRRRVDPRRGRRRGRDCPARARCSAR